MTAEDPSSFLAFFWLRTSVLAVTSLVPPRLSRIIPWLPAVCFPLLWMIIHWILAALGLPFSPWSLQLSFCSVFAATSQTGEGDFILHPRPRFCSLIGETQLSNYENHFSRSDFRQGRQ
jgi:hypothetical protein